jgi:hypothetical protein
VGYNRVRSGILALIAADGADWCRVSSLRLLRLWESKTCRSTKSGTWKANPSNDSSTRLWHMYADVLDNRGKYTVLSFSSNTDLRAARSQILIREGE